MGRPSKRLRLPMEGFLECACCHELRKVEDFYPSELGRSRCKQCTKAKHKEWQTAKRKYANAKRLAWAKAHPERMRAIWERHIAKPGVKEKRKASTLRWRQAQPKKDTPKRRIRLQQLGLSEAQRLKAAYERYVSKPSIRQKRTDAARRWQANNRMRVSAIEAHRRALKRGAMPKWANRFFIDEAYALARLRTKITNLQWDVDHIVPLKHPLVCGLHVEHNLQLIPKSLNSAKGNRYWPDMP
jgi:hypothetical protein